MDPLELAYRRSALPSLGISYARAVAEPALRATLELMERIQAMEARRAQKNPAGRYLERTAQ